MLTISVAWIIYYGSSTKEGVRRWGSATFYDHTRHRVSRERRNLGSFQKWRRRSEIKKLIGAFGNVLNWREQILLGKISAKMPDTRARGTVKSVDSFSYSSPFLLRHLFFLFCVCVARPGSGGDRRRPHRRLVWIHFSAKSILDRVYARVYVRIRVGIWWYRFSVCMCVVPRSRWGFSRFYRWSVCNCLFHVGG